MVMPYHTRAEARRPLEREGRIRPASQTLWLIV